jgi:hypothetical protein
MTRNQHLTSSNNKMSAKNHHNEKNSYNFIKAEKWGKSDYRRDAEQAKVRHFLIAFVCANVHKCLYLKHSPMSIAGRSSDFGVILTVRLPIRLMRTVAWWTACNPLQRRNRAGFSPASLLSSEEHRQ